VDAAGPAFKLFSTAGQAYAPLSESHETTTCADGKPEADPDAEARFDEHSNLPRLPEGFELRQHNILLVSWEATRFDATSFSEKNPDNTPRVKEFSQGRFWYERAYTVSPHTLQTFAAMFSLTMQSAAEIEITNRPWFGTLLPSQETVAELLSENGWGTFWVGHNYRNFLMRTAKGLDQGFDQISLTRARDKSKKVDGRIAYDAIAAIDDFAAKQEPFFGWVFFVSPHSPYLRQYPEDEDTSLRGRYDQEVRYMDAQTGRLLDHLRATGLLENTIVIIHGDHGEEFGEHGSTQHHSLYIEVAHVPLVIHVPGTEGAKVEGPTSLAYVFPWLLLHGPPPLRNAALTKLREEIGPMMRDTDNGVVLERIGKQGAQTSLIWNDYQLLFRRSSGYMELYDLERDPSEKHNIYEKDIGAADKTRRLLRNYTALRNCFRRWRPAAE
jgi:arylsulfatase A-like enzyme